MKKKLIIGLGVLLGAGILFSLVRSPLSLWDVLTQPFQSLWGSHQQLETGVLEVSEHIDPLEQATRRLLKPFGGVRLIRRFPAPVPEEVPPKKRS